MNKKIRYEEPKMPESLRKLMEIENDPPRKKKKKRPEEGPRSTKTAKRGLVKRALPIKPRRLDLVRKDRKGLKSQVVSR